MTERTLVVILSGGLQTRFRKDARGTSYEDLAETTPKLLFPLNPTNETPFSRQLEALQLVRGEKQVRVPVSREFYEMTERAAARYRWLFGLDIEVLPNEATTNETRLGALADLERSLYGDWSQALVSPSDRVPRKGYRSAPFLEAAAERDCLYVMRTHVQTLEEAKSHGVITINEEGRILEFHEKPENPTTTDIAFANYVFRPEDGTTLQVHNRSGYPLDPPGHFIAYQVEQGERVYTFYVDPEIIQDVGRLDHYLKVRE
ncbi:MAG: hypothetical protein KKA90_04855 [Nanoarchaeota archaeon]|nr:hypothetical protein [Nanoarchaeota archaeon]